MLPFALQTEPSDTRQYDYVEFNRDVKTSNTAIEMMCRPGRRYVPTDRNEAYQARR